MNRLLHWATVLGLACIQVLANTVRKIVCCVVLLLAAVPLIAGNANAATLTNVSVALSDYTVDANSTATLTYTAPTGTGAGQYFLVLEFPAGFTLANGAMWSGCGATITVNSAPYTPGNCLLNAGVANKVIFITSSAIPPASTIVITIDSSKVKNGSTAGLYSFPQWFTSDGTGGTQIDVASPLPSVTLVPAVVAPGAPTIGSATAGAASATVAFAAPASNGGAAISGYTATASPGGLTGTGASSPITVSGLTNGVAYTFTVTATNSAGTGSASSASNSVTPKASQTITFGNPGAQSLGTTPTLTASSSAGGGYPVSFTSATTGVCTITTGGVLTLVTTGSCTINANQAGDASTLAATQVAQSFDVTSNPVPIPSVVIPPQVPGVGSNLLSPLNLSSGNGPAMTNCLRDALRTVIGADAVYQGQTTDGGARIGQTTLVVSFYALEASTSTNNPGINLRGSNPLSVLTSCGTFTTVPSVYNLGEWGTYLNGRGLSTTFNAQGVMTVVVGGTTYVARPDYVVTQGTPGAPSLTTGSDGLMRFTDSAGNVQILYPAFIDPEVLVNQIAQAFGGYTLIQTDGTALVTLLNGQKFVLTPDMTLGTVPPEQFAASWWQDGPNHYRYRIASRGETSQGFTLRAVP